MNCRLSALSYYTQTQATSFAHFTTVLRIFATISGQDVARLTWYFVWNRIWIKLETILNKFSNALDDIDNVLNDLLSKYFDLCIKILIYFWEKIHCMFGFRIIFYVFCHIWRFISWSQNDNWEPPAWFVYVFGNGFVGVEEIYSLNCLFRNAKCSPLGSIHPFEKKWEGSDVKMYLEVYYPYFLSNVEYSQPSCITQ